MKVASITIRKGFELRFCAFTKINSMILILICFGASFILFDLISSFTTYLLNINENEKNAGNHFILAKFAIIFVCIKWCHNNRISVDLWGVHFWWHLILFFPILQKVKSVPTAYEIFSTFSLQPNFYSILNHIYIWACILFL